MVAHGIKPAKLTRDRLSELRDLEKRLGVVLLALEPEFSPAKLQPAQLKRIQALEDEMGVVLVAYRRR
jgi:hypothetical protein